MTNIINSPQPPHFDVSWDGPKMTDTLLDDSIKNMTIRHTGKRDMTIQSHRTE